ncbi:DUF4333 domain-containing protein [Amycolatopsis cynarae]|uniref:DUF4333 domain-containing protein n=1 Tax=Amycolatopsis cynarae TaxID=2995223 RepID=A0ABY7ATL5_9PSEU|nr:DUF4333 domain-containing protein [Amycolatopsis sp. HUAS 11-8]WAL63304.1 DUF4333 domain-containing protein [Amycolatopsis sp. HUAS 11-8]
MLPRARTCVALASGALLLTGCGNGGHTPGFSSGSSEAAAPPVRVFDADAVQAGVRHLLTQSYGLTGVGTVRCPSGQVVQAGISFACVVEVNGSRRTVTLTVRDADGTYAVSAPQP